MPLPRVSAGGSSSSSLHVTLEMLEGLQYSVTIIGYQVEYRESGSSEWISRTVDASSYCHSFNLTELNAYTTYQIRAAVMVQEFMATESLVFSDVLHATTFEGGAHVLNGYFHVILMPGKGGEFLSTLLQSGTLFPD